MLVWQRELSTIVQDGTFEGYQDKKPPDKNPRTKTPWTKFRSPLVLVCEQKRCSHMKLVLNCTLDSLVNTHHLQQYSPFSLHYWSSWIMSDQTKVE